LRKSVIGIDPDALREIESASVPSHNPHTVILRHPDSPYLPAVTVESAAEILSDKLRAFAAREYLKSRDIRDMPFLQSTLKVSVSQGVIEMLKKNTADFCAEPSKALGRAPAEMATCGL
jgi:hypothetical protein